MPVSSTATVTPLPSMPFAHNCDAPVVFGNTAAGARGRANEASATETVDVRRDDEIRLGRRAASWPA